MTQSLALWRHVCVTAQTRPVSQTRLPVMMTGPSRSGSSTLAHSTITSYVTLTEHRQNVTENVVTWCGSLRHKKVDDVEPWVNLEFKPWLCLIIRFFAASSKRFTCAGRRGNISKTKTSLDCHRTKHPCVETILTTVLLRFKTIALSEKRLV